MLQKRLGQLSDRFLKYGLHKSLHLFCVYFCFDKFFEKRNKLSKRVSAFFILRVLLSIVSSWYYLSAFSAIHCVALRCNLRRCSTPVSLHAERGILSPLLFFFLFFLSFFFMPQTPQSSQNFGQKMVWKVENVGPNPVCPMSHRKWTECQNATSMSQVTALDESIEIVQ